jgi:hypothetical protein
VCVCAGEAIFQGILKARPSDYWATTLVGGCRMWSGRPKEGEPFLRKAIALDPNIPNAHTALAQCLGLQWRGAEAAKVVESMIGREFKTLTDNPDHRKQITDALDVAERVYGKSSQQFKVSAPLFFCGLCFVVSVSVVLIAVCVVPSGAGRSSDPELPDCGTRHQTEIPLILYLYVLSASCSVPNHSFFFSLSVFFSLGY